MNALIIIDVQNDFLPGGALAVPEGDKVIPVINKIIPEFDIVIATQDWHPQNHISFASNHKNKKPFDEIMIESEKQILWPDHCVQGTEGAELADALKKNRIEAIIRKGTDSSIDSYSAFYDNQHKKKTGLDGYLNSRGVKEIYLSGLAGDICVYYTIKDSLNMGFRIHLIKNAAKPINENNYQRILDELTSKGVIIEER